MTIMDLSAHTLLLQHGHTCLSGIALSFEVCVHWLSAHGIAVVLTRVLTGAHTCWPSYASFTFSAHQICEPLWKCSGTPNCGVARNCSACGLMGLGQHALDSLEPSLPN